MIVFKRRGSVWERRLKSQELPTERFWRKMDERSTRNQEMLDEALAPRGRVPGQMPLSPGEVWEYALEASPDWWAQQRSAVAAIPDERQRALAGSTLFELMARVELQKRGMAEPTPGQEAP